jgi:hypothetical protein
VQVMLKMKSRHVAGTITKKKKSKWQNSKHGASTASHHIVAVTCDVLIILIRAGVVVDVCKDVPAWPGRHLLEDGEHRRRYFGLRTAEHRVIEFECTSQREYEMWTKGVARLLSLAGERKRLA